MAPLLGSVQLKEAMAMVNDKGKRAADVLPSLEVSDPGLEQLKEEIRREVAALRSSGGELFPNATSAATRFRPFDLSSVRSMIDLADSFADVGLHVPPVHRYRGVARRLARLTARLILTLSRFITDRQRNFNHMATRSLSTLADGLERSNTSLADQVQALEELSRRHEERIASLEAALKSREEPIKRNPSGSGPARPEA